MVRVWLMAVALTLGPAPPASSATDYDLVWTAFAREARWQGGESQAVAAGERSGRARARLVPSRAGSLRLEWQGEGGDGHGLIGPGGPVSLTFPSPLVITGPPALPHLSGGTYQFSGERDRPESFTLSYVEGFICRTEPRVCEGVTMWERRFEGRATRRADQPPGGRVGSLPGCAASVTPLVSSLGVNGLSTTCTPLWAARVMTSRVPWAVIMTTRSPGRSAHAR